MKYRKRPVVIEAILWQGWSTPDTRLLTDGTPTTNAFIMNDGRLKITTLEGDMIAEIGDYVIRGVAGECYPCKPDIFAMTYEPV